MKVFHKLCTRKPLLSSKIHNISDFPSPNNVGQYVSYLQFLNLRDTRDLSFVEHHTSSTSQSCVIFPSMQFSHHWCWLASSLSYPFLDPPCAIVPSWVFYALFSSRIPWHCCSQTTYIFQSCSRLRTPISHPLSYDLRLVPYFSTLHKFHSVLSHDHHLFTFN